MRGIVGKGMEMRGVLGEKGERRRPQVMPRGANRSGERDSFDRQESVLDAEATRIATDRRV
jgi:hypothetical protein